MEFGFHEELLEPLVAAFGEGADGALAPFMEAEVSGSAATAATTATAAARDEEEDDDEDAGELTTFTLSWWSQARA